MFRGRAANGSRETRSLTTDPTSHIAVQISRWRGWRRLAGEALGGQRALAPVTSSSAPTRRWPRACLLQGHGEKSRRPRRNPVSERRTTNQRCDGMQGPGANARAPLDM